MRRSAISITALAFGVLSACGGSLSPEEKYRHAIDCNLTILTYAVGNADFVVDSKKTSPPLAPASDATAKLIMEAMKNNMLSAHEIGATLKKTTAEIEKDLWNTDAMHRDPADPTGPSLELKRAFVTAPDGTTTASPEFSESLKQCDLLVLGT